MNDTTTIVLVVIAVLVVLAVVGVLLARRSRSRRLQQQFGPEYDRTVAGTGTRSDAERELQARAERRSELDIRPLDPQRRDLFAAEWRATQEDFVDQPAEAVRRADGLVERVMKERGYPVEDADQMTRDVSVDHAHVVSEYRSARALSQLNDRQQATTEQLREAMVHYRSMFADLLDAGDHDRGGQPYPEQGSPGDRAATERERR